MGLNSGLGINGVKQGVCTSSTRPSNPYAGMRIYETDTGREYMHDGGGWVIMSEPTQTFAAQIDQGASTNIAKTVAQAEYMRSNGWITVQFRLGPSGSGTAGAALTVAMPVLPFSVNNVSGGSGFVYDSSLATLTVTASLVDLNGKLNFTTSSGGGSAWGVIPNLAITSGDVISACVSYRMASRYY